MFYRIFLPVIVVALILLSQSIYQVDQWEQAAVFRFGEIQKIDKEPGLHFMVPFMNTVKTFETRLINMDQAPQRFLTAENKYLIVDYFVKWRISNVKKFYTSTRGGDVEYANSQLGLRINRALRDEFGKRSVQQVVAGERGEIFDIVEGTTEHLQDELGITVVDVKTKRIDLPEGVSHSVYDRMRAERLRAAKEHRAKGEEDAERIKAASDKERQIILADAYKDAQITRGEGDAHATDIYASAYNKDPDFFSFYRSLNAYRNSFSDKKDILLLSPDSEFFKYFKSANGK